MQRKLYMLTYLLGNCFGRHRQSHSVHAPHRGRRYRHTSAHVSLNPVNLPMTKSPLSVDLPNADTETKAHINNRTALIFEWLLVGKLLCANI